MLPITRLYRDETGMYSLKSEISNTPIISFELDEMTGDIRIEKCGSLNE